MDGNTHIRENAHAVIIGINEYQDPHIPNLTCARADAEGLYRILTDPELGAFSADNIILLLDREATQRNIRTAIGRDLRRRADKDSLVCIYYAGHGSAEIDPQCHYQDGIEKYMVPSDAELDNLFSSGIAMDEVQRFFERIEAKQIIFYIDSCYSGEAGGRTFQNPRYQKRAALTSEFLDGISGEGRLVITACDVNEVSLETRDIGHGLFTHYLIEGLKGYADKDNDGLVTAHELYDYVFENVSGHARRMGGSMHPIQKGSIRGKIVLAHYETETQKKAKEISTQAQLHFNAREYNKAYDLWQQVRALVPEHEEANRVIMEIERIRDEEDRKRKQAQEHRKRVLLNLYHDADLPADEFKLGMELIEKSASELTEEESRVRKLLEDLIKGEISARIYLDSVLLERTTVLQEAEPPEARTLEPKQVEPKVAEPPPAKPKPAEPKTAEPELGKPIAPEPKPIRPKPAKPVAAKPTPTEQKAPTASKAYLIMALGGLICLALLAAVFGFELALKSILFGVFASALVHTSIIFTMGVSLALVLRVNRIVNLAHGSMYVLGACVTHSLAGLMGLDGFGFFAIAVLAALLIGMLGVFIETLLFRRVYQLPVILRLLAALGVVLVLRNVILAIWGPDVLTLKSTFFNRMYYLIPLGPFVLAGLIVLLHGTHWFARHYQATVDQGDGVGTNVEHRNFRTTVFFIATALAAFTGAFTLSASYITPTSDINVLVEASLVTLLAGLGSPVGVFLAAMVIGTLRAFSSFYWGGPAGDITVFIGVFIVAALVLTLRPTGFFGRAEPLYLDTAPVRSAGRPGRRLRQAAVAALILLLAVPAVAGAFTMAIMIWILAFALLGASLHFLIKTEGFVSLGHGAFVAIGAYSMAILSVRLGVPFALALPMGAAAACLCGLLFAIPCARLSPAFAAMLSLVFAHAVSRAFSEAEAITGGAMGLPLPGQVGYWEIYYGALLLCTGGIALLWYLPTSRIYSQAHEQAGLTAQAKSATPRLYKTTTLSFALAGAIAGLVGGLIASYHGYINPYMFGTEMSFDALSMLVIGGVQSFLGPLLGPATVTWLKQLARDWTGFWQVTTGAAVIVIVLLYPKGISGLLESLLGEKHLTDILPIWKTDKRPTEELPGGITKKIS